MSVTPFSDEILVYLNDRLVTATERSEALRREAERAEETRQTWKQVLNYVNKGWYLHIIELFKVKDSILKTSETDPIAGQIYIVAEEQSSVLLRRFPSFLEAACNAAGLAIDRNCQHPSYKFDEGFFQVQVDDRNGVARLSDSEGPLSEFPCDPVAIVEAVKKEHARIFERSFDGLKFLEMLRHHYRAIVVKLGKQDGEAIPIRSITTRLGKNQKGFRTDEFVADLSQLIAKGPSNIDGFRFDLQQTKSTNQGMLLHGIAGGGYVGFITFKKEQ